MATQSEWYRKRTALGSLIFMTKTDSKRLLQAHSVFTDGTFQPINPFKGLFCQLYIISVKQEFHGRTRSLPCCFIYMHKRDILHYKDAMESVKGIYSKNIIYIYI